MSLSEARFKVDQEIQRLADLSMIAGRSADAVDHYQYQRQKENVTQALNLLVGQARELGPVLIDWDEGITREDTDPFLLEDEDEPGQAPWLTRCNQILRKLRGLDGVAQ